MLLELLLSEMSSNYGGSAVIEGSLTAAIDDDSSDDERDDELSQDSHLDAKVAAHAMVDDDDEELEVFSKGVVHFSKTPQPAPTAGTSLIDAMMASVSEVEMSGSEVPLKVPKSVIAPKVSDPFPVKTTSTTLDDGDKPEGDLFSYIISVEEDYTFCSSIPILICFALTSVVQR